MQDNQNAPLGTDTDDEQDTPLATSTDIEQNTPPGTGTDWADSFPHDRIRLNKKWTGTVMITVPVPKSLSFSCGVSPQSP